MDRRPPLAVSPRRLRPRRNLRAAVPPVQTPPPASSKKTQLPIRSPASMIPLIQPEYHIISSELVKMAKRVDQESGENQDLGLGLDSSPLPLFERGRFYDVYSARRNERLRRKKAEILEDETVAQDPGIAIELAKKRGLKKTESLRKSVPANFSVSRGSSLRSSVRTGKEIKKANVGLESCQKSGAGIGRRIGTRSVRKI